jgi:3D (Asp-Asp-Asp) domain-containing protein
LQRRIAAVSGRILALAAASVAAFCAGGAAAGPGGDANALRAENTALAGRERAALLDLYALDSRLSRAHARLAELDARAAALVRERADVRLQVRVAHHALTTSQRNLAQRLRALYMQPDPDPVAIVLGASSLDDALTALDDMSRTAKLDQRTVAQTTRARRTLHELAVRLRARAAAVDALRVEARRTAAALERARAERQRFLATLARQRRLNADRIAELASAAHAAVVRSAAVAPASSTASATPASAPPASAADLTVVPAAGQTLTVSASGYALQGQTASGVGVGWGIVAVDPSVIPLGTRLTIPGYGEGVAADTGSAIQGLAIDLWFPTEAQALAWGRRTVTVTLH